MGDVILFGQLLQTLGRRWGGAVRLAAGGQKARLLAGLGAVDEAVDLEALPMHEVFAASPLEECSLSGRLGPCDVLVSCFAAGDAAAQDRLAALCRARESVFLPVRPPRGYAAHLLDLWAEQVGVGEVPPPRWAVPDEWRRRARQALSDTGISPARPYVLVHPGAGSREKCWPPERFRRLAGRLAGLSACRGLAVRPARPHGLAVRPARTRRPARERPAILFVLGPTELDWWGMEAVAALRAETPTLVAPPLAVLAGLCAGAAAFVGNDSGPTHLAAAVGTPTVALFGPTSPAQFAPRGRRGAVVSAGGMADISMEAVAAAVERR